MVKRPAILNAISAIGLAPVGWAVSAACAFVLLFVVWFIATEPGRQRAKALNAEVQSELSGARTKAAGDAIATNEAASKAAAASENLSRETADEIRKAPGADVRLDPDLNRVARERLCRRDAYRLAPECLQRPSGLEPAR